MIKGFKDFILRGNVIEVPLPPLPKLRVQEDYPL